VCIVIDTSNQRKGNHEHHHRNLLLPLGRRQRLHRRQPRLHHHRRGHGIRRRKPHPLLERVRIQNPRNLNQQRNTTGPGFGRVFVFSTTLNGWQQSPAPDADSNGPSTPSDATPTSAHHAVPAKSKQFTPNKANAFLGTATSQPTKSHPSTTTATPSCPVSEPVATKTVSPRPTVSVDRCKLPHNRQRKDNHHGCQH